MLKILGIKASPVGSSSQLSTPQWSPAAQWSCSSQSPWWTSFQANGNTVFKYQNGNAVQYKSQIEGYLSNGARRFRQTALITDGTNYHSFNLNPFSFDFSQFSSYIYRPTHPPTNLDVSGDRLPVANWSWSGADDSRRPNSCQHSYNKICSKISW